MRKKQKCELLQIKIFFMFFGEDSKSLVLCFPAFLLQSFPEHLFCETGHSAATKFFEGWEGACTVALHQGRQPGHDMHGEFWMCHQLCEPWCFCESFSWCPERCWSSYRNMGGFAMEAFHLGKCLSGQKSVQAMLVSSFTTIQMQTCGIPTLSWRSYTRTQLKGFGSQSQTERAAFRPKNFHLCPEHLRDK